MQILCLVFFFQNISLPSITRPSFGKWWCLFLGAVSCIFYLFFNTIFSPFLFALPLTNYSQEIVMVRFLIVPKSRLGKSSTGRKLCMLTFISFKENKIIELCFSSLGSFFVQAFFFFFLLVFLEEWFVEMSLWICPYETIFTLSPICQYLLVINSGSCRSFSSIIFNNTSVE